MLWVLNSELYAEPDGLVTRASNVHSLAAATGIPRETVRRKVKALVAAGWVERSRAGHLTLKPPTAQHLAALAAYTDVLSSFLATARALEALLARKAALADPLPP